MLALIAGLWLILVGLGVAENARHQAILRRIPIRIHVNGTRGKTSVSRLIGAGLRAGGRRTCVKTTGSAATLTDPEGREFPLYRRNQANIIEQMRVMARMLEFRPEIAVIECMALHPHYQSLTELRMLRSAIGVITNARPDHLEVMGPTERDVALALAGSVPAGGDLFTAEERLLDVFAAAAGDRATRVHAMKRDHVESIGDEILSRFSYSEHADNVALALRVCAHLGVDRETALRGMSSLRPEPGAMRVLYLRYFDRDLVFVNAFAANDPESTARIWQQVVEKHGADRRRIALVNCRADRPYRSQQIASAVPQWPAADRYILTGSGTLLFARAAVRHGLDPERLIMAENASMTEIVETILEHSGRRSLIVGMCNIHGGGAEVVRFFENRTLRMTGI
jgi:poly-gamma-glutamate synthase PgsB/CapB